MSRIQALQPQSQFRITTTIAAKVQRLAPTVVLVMVMFMVMIMAMILVMAAVMTKMWSI